MNRIVSRVVVPVAILAGAGVVANVMINSAESAERSPSEAEPPRVDYVQVRAEATAPHVRGTGIVEPTREATLSPQVNGQITYLSPALVVGGRVAEGDILVKLEQRDYKIAVRQQKASVQQAQVELELEQAYGKVSEQEWALMGDPQVDDRLATRKPQGEAAKIKVSSARASLERAKLDLGRTTIRAPFNATVTSESVELGEIASPGVAIATLVGTDSLLVRVSVPVEYLRLIDIPTEPGQAGSTAIVTQRLGRDAQVERPGEVVRLVHQLDPESRTASVLVEVRDPLDPPEGGLPLLPGAYVDVALTGNTTQDVVAVPRVAVFEGRSVWVIDEDDTLRKRTLRIAWGDDDTVYATAGVKTGERVAITVPPRAIEGLRVRSQLDESAERISSAEPVTAGALEQPTKPEQPAEG